MTKLQGNWRSLIEEVSAAQDSPPGALTELTDSQLWQQIEARLRHPDAAQFTPELQQYFADNPAQQPLFAELLALFQADPLAGRVEPITPPGFNLNFLGKSKSNPTTASAAEPQPYFVFPAQVKEAFASGRTWVWDQLGTLWVDFSAAILSSAPRQPVLVTRSQVAPPDKDGVIYRLSLGSEMLGDLDIEVKAIQSAEPEFCTLHITAHVPSRWPEASNVTITILRSEPIRTGKTDPQDQLIFEHFPIKDLAQIGFKIDRA